MFGRKGLHCGRVTPDLQRFGIVRRLMSFTPKALVSPVSDDATKPGSQPGRIAQKGEMIPGCNERFLRNILTLAQIANPAVCQGTDQCLVTRHNAPKGIAIAVQTARDEL